jgi:hypothetical protein
MPPNATSELVAQSVYINFRLRNELEQIEVKGSIVF